jgi:hypothetical protein
MYVQTDTRKCNAAAESHSDVYEQTILYTNRHEAEALGPRFNNRENLFVCHDPLLEKTGRGHVYIKF